MPPEGVIKCNVHRFFTNEPLENGNQSGIGVVFRNCEEMIIWVVAGSLGHEDRLMNEYSALFEGLNEAYYKNYKNIILEINHVEAYWNWYNSSVLGGPAEYANIMQQLNQRKADKNFKTHGRLVDEEDNALSTYLARHGAEHWKQMVAIREMFGRVRELWMLYIGLGSDEERFQVVFEEELDHRRMADKVVDPESNHGNTEEMDVGDENQVVVTGLTAAPMHNADEQLGEQAVVEGVEMDGAAANHNAANV